jgi:hypothetical protein
VGEFWLRLLSARRGLVHLALAAAVAPALAAVPGAAQTRSADAASASAPKKAVAPSGPVLAVVSIASQRVQIYGRAGLVAQSPVSTGMAGHRTPAGVFSVLEKERFHRSNIYSDAPMPYMQRITWSGVALHAGVLPGYPASHGCIRLPYPFSVELWGITRVGTRVVVAPDDPAVVPIESRLLPALKLTPVVPDDADERNDAGSGKGPELASAAGATASDAVADPARARLLDPLQRARAMKAQARRGLVAKTKAARLAAETAAAKAAEARRAAAVLQMAEQALAAARRRYDATAEAAEAAAKAAETTAHPGAAERADRLREALDRVEADLTGAERTAEDARQVEALVAAEAAAAAAGAVEAENARHDAVETAKAAERSEEPISILVSRKTGRVYVRQAWAPVHEAPVTFTDTGAALGTHLFLAMGAGEDGETMQWVSVSLPASAPEPSRQHDRTSQALRAAPALPAPGLPTETAASVLGRFELPQATRKFIEDRLWAGAALIVSDQAMSGETGLSTDFIVLTR